MNQTHQSAINSIRGICSVMQSLAVNEHFAIPLQEAMSSGDDAEFGRLIKQGYLSHIAQFAGNQPESIDYDLCIGEDADIDEFIPCSVSYVVEFGYVRVISVASLHNNCFIDWFTAGLLTDEAMNDIMTKIGEQVEEVA